MPHLTPAQRHADELEAAVLRTYIHNHPDAHVPPISPLTIEAVRSNFPDDSHGFVTIPAKLAILAADELRRGDRHIRPTPHRVSTKPTPQEIPKTPTGRPNLTHLLAAGITTAELEEALNTVRAAIHTDTTTHRLPPDPTDTATATGLLHPHQGA